MTNATARLACLRHGESENVVRRQVGALPGMRLTGRGRDQAAAAADLLRGWRAETIYASDAVRAQETAAIIAAALHLDVTVLPGLAEVGIGAREGAADPATWRCVAQVLQTWLVRGDLGPRVADGENGHEVTGRVSQALAGIAAAHPGRTAIVVGHTGSLAAAVSVLCGGGPALWGAPLPHAAPFPLTREGPRWRCDWPGLPQVPAT
ncbi:MAG: histidine phosphatase family protein [Streptosporangiaceae bacterium]